MNSTRRNQTIPQSAKTPPSGSTLLDVVKSSLDDDKAKDIVVIELVGKSEIADYLVVASGTSQRHVGAMGEHLREQIKKAGLETVPVEGLTQCDWVLVDGGDIIVHLFRPEVREFYNIEKMWGDSASNPEEGPTGTTRL